MRPSSRTLILDAAVRVTEREGITALTLEAAAEEAGLTKGGLLYHFRTREDLLVGIQRHIVQGLEDLFLADLGVPWEEADPAARGTTYIRVMMRQTTRYADLAFMLESVNHPELARVWDELLERWAPAPDTPEPARMDLFLARLAVDGLWMFYASPGASLTEATRQAVLERVAELANTTPEHDTAPEGSEKRERS